MSLSEKFNQIYKSEDTPRYEKSLKIFFQSEVTKRLALPARILDLGAGSKSLFSDLDLDEMDVTAIDFSSEAIFKAQNKDHLNYVLKDITKPKALEENTYDLIFDSHCLHCINDPGERIQAFKNIHQALKSEGIFAGEMMVRSRGSETNSPYKYIPEARSLEEEILSHKFKIIYFMIVRDLSFIEGQGECDLLRVIVKKSSS